MALTGGAEPGLRGSGPEAGLEGPRRPLVWDGAWGRRRAEAHSHPAPPHGCGGACPLADPGSGAQTGFPASFPRPSSPSCRPLPSKQAPGPPPSVGSGKGTQLPSGELMLGGCYRRPRPQRLPGSGSVARRPGPLHKPAWTHHPARPPARPPAASSSGSCVLWREAAGTPEPATPWRPERLLASPLVRPSTEPRRPLSPPCSAIPRPAPHGGAHQPPSPGRPAHCLGRRASQRGGGGGPVAAHPPPPLPPSGLLSPMQASAELVAAIRKRAAKTRQHQ